MVLFVVVISSLYFLPLQCSNSLDFDFILQPYRQLLGNCCNNNTLPCVSASEDFKDEPVKNPQAVKPQDDRSPAAQGTESLVTNVFC